MNRIASFHLRAATVYALIGMAWGIHMGMSGDHTLFPAHAHLNLLGWVSVFLYGLFFAGVPKAAAGRLPVVHALIAHLGILLMIPGVVLAIGEVEIGEPLVGIGSILVILSMLIFAIIVFRSSGRA
jgi:hypothetical protein